jgi:hypothetical protein
MKLQEFYTILDSELEDIIKDNPLDKRLHQNPDGKKGYAFLIWFLQFYGQKSIFNQYITDGDDDSSCDIMFSNSDLEGRKVFYVVQSKWNISANSGKKIDSNTFKSTLNDFQHILTGQKKETRNINFNKKYEELKTHIEANGDVKFIYLSLCQNNSSIKEIKESFEKRNNCAVEIIDIERLKRDFIEVRYKEIKPANPLEYDYNPEIESIVLDIEQLGIERNYLEIKAPFESYIFFVRPKTIHDLFEKYGFKMFFRNVRNPLIASDYNKEIEHSLRDNPSYFWYFNNGITAITQSPPKKINGISKQIDITGLQVINGAQTVYSIYKAYQEAKNGQKNVINDNALISFRLIRGGNKDFELDVTRYTNQQNEIQPRDFWANDATQIRLQNESFRSNYWYEIRRGEFRHTPKTIEYVDNVEFAKAYLTIFLQKPYLLDESMIFVSYKENEKGLYEVIFNEKSYFEDMLSVYMLFQNLELYMKAKSKKPYISLGLFKTVFERVKPEGIPFSKALNGLMENEKSLVFIFKIQLFILEKIKEHDNLESKNVIRSIIGFFSNKSKFESLMSYFENIVFTKEDIDKVVFDENELGATLITFAVNSFAKYFNK